MHVGGTFLWLVGNGSAAGRTGDRGHDCEQDELYNNELPGAARRTRTRCCLRACVVGRAARAPARQHRPQHHPSVLVRLRCAPRYILAVKTKGTWARSRARSATRLRSGRSARARLPIRRAAAHALPARRTARTGARHTGIEQPKAARALARRRRSVHNANLLRAVAMPANPVGRLCRRRSQATAGMAASTAGGGGGASRRQRVDSAARRHRRRRRRRRRRGGDGRGLLHVTPQRPESTDMARLLAASSRPDGSSRRGAQVPCVADAQPQLPTTSARRTAARLRAAELARAGTTTSSSTDARRRRYQTDEAIWSRARPMPPIPFGLRRALPARADAYLQGASPRQPHQASLLLSFKGGYKASRARSTPPGTTPRTSSPAPTWSSERPASTTTSCRCAWVLAAISCPALSTPLPRTHQAHLPHPTLRTIHHPRSAAALAPRSRPPATACTRRA